MMLLMRIERDTELPGHRPEKPSDIMEKFIKQIEPIIKSKIKKYRPYIKNFDFEDLMQEGYLAALIAANRWKIHPDKAGLIAWTWIHIESKFKELSMKSNDKEVSIEDLEIEISQEQVSVSLDQNLGQGDYDERYEYMIKMLIKFMPKHEEFLERIIDENLTNISAAKDMGLTKQRISQLHKEIRSTFVTV